LTSSKSAPEFKGSRYEKAAELVVDLCGLEPFVPGWLYPQPGMRRFVPARPKAPEVVVVGTLHNANWGLVLAGRKIGL